MNRKLLMRRRARTTDAVPAPVRWPSLIRLARRATRLLSVLMVMGGLIGMALMLFSTGAYADDGNGKDTVPGPDSIEAVIGNVRTWLLGILVAVATLFLTIGGLRLMWANGDPGEAEKGKAALKSAAIGYMLALLAPLIVTIVGRWVA